MTVWRAIFKNIPRTKHDYVYGALFRLFSNTTDSYPVKEEIARTYDMLEYVFDLLIRPGTSTARTPVQFALRSWENHSLIESAEDVRRALNSVLRIKPPLTPDDLILFSNLALLKGMSNIFNKFKDRLVRRHLAWLFVWAYGIMANPAAILEVMHGDKTRAEQSRIRYCAAQVEANYKLLVAAMTIASYFPSEKRALIDEHLSGIVEMAIKKTSAASWLDNQTIGVAVKKLKNVRTLLWPTEKYLTVEGIEEAYANFSENASSFAHLWIDARRNIRNLFGSEAGVQEQRLRLSSAQPYIEYVPVLNVLALSLGALAPPLFYPDGTNAMMHGGLGYFYARELVGAIDREGVKVDPLGHIVPSWLSEAVKPRFRQRDQGCLHYNSSVFPEVPAMEVAFAAFQQHAENSDLQLTN
ncbi:hypothetical protein V5799_024351, partial [Amblyomma americanum]